MESTAQRNSRIANENAGAHTEYAHAKDFFNGLATYEIKPSLGKSFSVIQNTPNGRLSGWAKNMEDALQMIEEWSNAEICNGYSRKQFA